MNVNEMKKVENELLSWREEDCHYVLLEHEGLTVYCGVAPPYNDTKPLLFHYHEHDTVYVALTKVAGVNEIIDLEKREEHHGLVDLEQGTVLVYNLRDSPKYVHRLRNSCTHPIAFIGVEVVAMPLPDTARRATLKNAFLLKPQGAFASVARIAIPPRASFQLARNNGFIPLRSVVVPLMYNGSGDNDCIVKADDRVVNGGTSDGLKDIMIRNAANCDFVRTTKHDFLVEAYVMCEKFAGTELKEEDEDAKCTIFNSSHKVWVGAIIDVWVTGKDEMSE